MINEERAVADQTLRGPCWRGAPFPVPPETPSACRFVILLYVRISRKKASRVQQYRKAYSIGVLFTFSLSSVPITCLGDGQAEILGQLTSMALDFASAWSLRISTSFSRILCLSVISAACWSEFCFKVMYWLHSRRTISVSR